MEHLGFENVAIKSHPRITDRHKAERVAYSENVREHIGEMRHFFLDESQVVDPRCKGRINVRKTDPNRSKKIR